MTNRNSRAYIDSDVFTRRYMYSTINNMGKRNKYTSWENESPVGPPMWNDPLENVSSQLPPFVPMPGREIRLNPSVYTERVLRRPVNPFPDGDPDLSINKVAADGAATAGTVSNDDNKNFCRECGPRIEGVIGVPNSDPTAPWPQRNADGSEQNPVNNLMHQGPILQPLRAEGMYVSPAYQNVLQSNWVTQSGNGYVSQPLMVTDNTLTANVDVPILGSSGGTIYFNGEDMTYANWIYNPVTQTTVFNGLVRQLPVANRIPREINDQVLILTGAPTGNNSADIVVTVDALGQISDNGVNLKTNLSRGSNFTNFLDITPDVDNVFIMFIVMNTELGGIPGSGAVFIQFLITHWPDEDVSSCLISGLSEDAKQYCCFEDSLTPIDWPGGAGRCASLAEYGVARPLEWVQNCPPGYEYTPGADGLFCTKCNTSTSSFDPTVDPVNCPANGVGCQKCCEDAGISCP